VLGLLRPAYLEEVVRDLLGELELL